MTDEHSNLSEIRTRSGQFNIAASVGGPPLSDGTMPIVLVHGYGVARSYLLPTAERLASDSPVLVPDLPGWGKSDEPSETLDVDALANVLADWMREVGVSRGVLVGNSFGCQIIVAAAERHPDLVAGAVLVGPTLDPAIRPLARLVMVLIRDVFRERPRELLIAVRDYLRFGFGQGRATLRFMRDDRIEERIAHIGVPVLVVRGEHDPIASRSWCHLLADRAQDGRFAEIADSAHAANFDSPASLADLVRLLVAEITTR